MKLCVWNFNLHFNFVVLFIYLFCFFFRVPTTFFLYFCVYSCCLNVVVVVSVKSKITDTKKSLKMLFLLSCTINGIHGGLVRFADNTISEIIWKKFAITYSYI